MATMLVVRVEAARRLLQTTDLTVGAIARRVGIRHAETLHRAFRRLTTRGLPDAYTDGGSLRQWFDVVVHRQSVTAAHPLPNG